MAISSRTGRRKTATMEIGNQIRKMRESRDLSQEELAHELFVSRQTISNWERGKTYPDVQSLLLLSNLFDAPIDDLVKGDEQTMDKARKDYGRRRALMIAGYVAMIALIAQGLITAAVFSREMLPITDPGVFSPFLIAIAIGLIVDYFERAHDTETLGEVLQFVNGRDPDEIIRARKVPRWIRRCAMFAACFLGSFVFMVLLSSLTRA